MTTAAGKTLAIAAAVMLLAGCSANAIKQDRARQAEEVNRIRIHSAPESPRPAALEAAYGAPAIYRAGDLTLSIYPLDYQQAHKLQKEARKAAKRAQKAAEKGKKEHSMGAGGYAALALLAPIWVPAMAFAIPLAAADYAAGSAIVAAEGDDPRNELTGLGALFVHDAEGAYRWQACCFDSGNLVDDMGPNISRLPYVSVPTGARPGAPDYRQDYRTLQCFRARAGDSVARAFLYHGANQKLPDPAWTYYWARTVDESGNPDRPRYLDWVKAAFPPEALAAGEAFYRAHPLDSLDCRAMAALVVDAEEAGTSGPEVTAVVPEWRE